VKLRLQNFALTTSSFTTTELHDNEFSTSSSLSNICRRTGKSPLIRQTWLPTSFDSLKIKTKLNETSGHRRRSECEDPQVQTANKKYYLQVLQRLGDAILRKRPEKWSQLLTKHEIPHVNKRPYSPDLAPSDYFCAPKWNSIWRGEDLTMWISWNAIRHSNFCRYQKRDFQKCFEQWKNRWNKLIESQGCYFEGN
jgi:hypothetical protein